MTIAFPTPLPNPSSVNLDTTITLGELANWKYHWWAIEVNGVAADVDPDVVGRIVAQEAMFLQELKIIYDYPSNLLVQIRASAKRQEFQAAVLAYRQRWIQQRMTEFQNQIDSELRNHQLSNDEINRYHF